MAIRKKEEIDAELAGVETKVPCPVCQKGLVSSTERDKLRRLLAAAAPKDEPA